MSIPTLDELIDDIKERMQSRPGEYLKMRLYYQGVASEKINRPLEGKNAAFAAQVVTVLFKHIESLDDGS